MTSGNDFPSGPGTYGQAEEWLSLAASLPGALAQQNVPPMPTLAQNGGLAGLLSGSYGLHSVPAPSISLRDNGFTSAPAPGSMNFSTNDFSSNSNNNNKLIQQAPAPANNNSAGASYISSEILALLSSSLRQQQPMQPSQLKQLGGGTTFLQTDMNQHTNNHHQLPGVLWGAEPTMLFNNNPNMDPSAIFEPNRCADPGGANAAALLNSLMPQSMRQLPQLSLLQQPEPHQHQHQHHQAPPALTMSAAQVAVPSPKEETTNIPGLAHCAPIMLFMDCDQDSLSEYQCYLRQQIEAFEAGPKDVKSTAQGRNTPIQLGQVGIRCRHCASLSKFKRPRGAIYYSQKIEGVYQVAQNMSKVHILGCCSQVPDHVKRKLLELKQVNQRASGGKDYWGDGLRALGIYEDGRCMRFHSTSTSRTLSASPPEQK